MLIGIEKKYNDMPNIMKLKVLKFNEEKFSYVFFFFLMS